MKKAGVKAQPPPTKGSIPLSKPLKATKHKTKVQPVTTKSKGRVGRRAQMNEEVGPLAAPIYTGGGWSNKGKHDPRTNKGS